MKIQLKRTGKGDIEMSQIIGVLSFICCLLLVGYHDWIVDQVPSPHDGMAFVLLFLVAIGLFFIGIGGITGHLKI